MKQNILIFLVIASGLVNFNCGVASYKTETSPAKIESQSVADLPMRQTKTIESVVSSSYVPPLTDINNSPAEAANS